MRFGVLILMLVAIYATSFFIFSKNGTDDDYLMDGGAGQIFYCSAALNCNNFDYSEYAYPYPGIVITYPLTVFGFAPYSIIMLFLIIFLPALFLYLKTDNLPFSFSWIFINLTYFAGNHLYAEGIVVICTMYLLLFDENFKSHPIIRYALYGLMMITHKTGWLLALMLFALESGLFKRFLEDKRITDILLCLTTILFFLVFSLLNSPFADVEQNPSNLYIIWISLPLIVLSIHRQEVELRNKALLSYIAVFAFSILVLFLHAGDTNFNRWIAYYDFMRIIVIVDLFSLAYIARGKHNKELLSYLGLFLSVSHFYRYAVNPFDKLKI
jgi:hypothetical protein